MKETKLLSLFSIVLLLTACSNNANDSISGNSFHYDTTLTYDETILSLDSISKCINDSAALNEFFKNDSFFTVNQNNKKLLNFQSYLYTSKKDIKSVGANVNGDTLKLALIEKAQTPMLELFCPVWVYTTVNGNINSKYISTASGVYTLNKN